MIRHVQGNTVRRLVRRPSAPGSDRCGSDSSQEHASRARTILLSDDGLGPVAIIAETGTSKVCVWRWQERCVEEGVDGLLRDKSRPPGKVPIADDVVAEIVRLAQEPPPPEATHWTLRAMSKAARVAASSVNAIW